MACVFFGDDFLFNDFRICAAVPNDINYINMSIGLNPNKNIYNVNKVYVRLGYIYSLVYDAK